MSKKVIIPEKVKSEIRHLPMMVLEVNEGQLKGLPANPRDILERKVELLKKNIKKYPEMLEYRSLLVYEYTEGRYIIIAGNMRYRAMAALGYETAPCIVIPKETTIAQLKAYTVLDNSGFGKWEWSMLANEWDEVDLVDWGIDLPIFENEINTDDLIEEGQKKRSGWKSEEDAKECVCDLELNVGIHKRGEVYFLSLFRKTNVGYPLSGIKESDNVKIFADNAVGVLRGVARLSDVSDWCIITSPKRRHKDWNFAEEVCKVISNKLSVPFYSDALSGKNKQRIGAEFTLNVEIKENNVIFFDDILTTGSTMKASIGAIEGKNVIVLVGINNN